MQSQSFTLASPLVRRDRSEARKRTLRFHASTIIETPPPPATPVGVVPERPRRVNTPWAMPMMMSWGDENTPWVAPGTPSFPSRSLSGTSNEVPGSSQVTTPPMSPGIRQDSLDHFVLALGPGDGAVFVAICGFEEGSQEWLRGGVVEGFLEAVASFHHMIAISDSEEEASAWGPKAPRAKRPKQGVGSAIEMESSSGKDCNPKWPGLPGLPCEICDKLIPSSEFLRHWKQHTLIPCECGESLDPKDFAEHMKKHERQTKLPTSETPELIPCEICGDFFLPSEYTEHWKGHEAKTSMSDLSNYTTPTAMAARWVEHLRCEAETQNLPASCIIVNFDLAVSFAERALRET
eukprot:symbB.v1.2.010500.t1/scaffold647.1/size176639/8